MTLAQAWALVRTLERMGKGDPMNMGCALATVLLDFNQRLHDLERSADADAELRRNRDEAAR